MSIFLLWEVLSASAGSEQLLPGPWKTFKSLARLFMDVSFLKVVGSTLLRGLAGFVIAVSTGFLIGVAGGLIPAVRSFVRPWVVVIRSVPVIAFALLSIIWLSPDSVPVFIGFLAMFPIIYINTSEGIASVDAELVEMARFYGLRGMRLLREIYIPAIRPFEAGAVSNAAGIGWRAIIVGEVLSQPLWGIGTVMHSAQTFLQVDILIAWTLVAVVLSALFDKLIASGYKSE